MIEEEYQNLDKKLERIREIEELAEYISKNGGNLSSAVKEEYASLTNSVTVLSVSELIGYHIFISRRNLTYLNEKLRKVDVLELRLDKKDRIIDEKSSELNKKIEEYRELFALSVKDEIRNGMYEECVKLRKDLLSHLKETCSPELYFEIERKITDILEIEEN